MKTKSANEVLVLGTSKRSASQLRRALNEIGRKYECEKCSLIHWHGQELTIEIHHLDGNPLNNVETNLQFLCPNCHSLTPNFYHTKRQSFCLCGNPKTKKGKQCRKCGSSGHTNPRPNQRKVARPNKEELESLVWLMPTVKIANKFGVSDKAISKWCKLYNIVKPGRGYWTNRSK